MFELNNKYIKAMKNLFLILAVLCSSTIFCQGTDVTITLEGEKDAEWMCGLVHLREFGISHEAIDCYDGHLFINNQTIEINITKPGGYCVRMKSSRYSKVTMVYFEIEEGDNYEVYKRVRGDKIQL